jgi:hypothetical protein
VDSGVLGILGFVVIVVALDLAALRFGHDSRGWARELPLAGDVTITRSRVPTVVWAYEAEIEAFRAMAEGRAVPSWTEESLDQANVEAGQAFAACDQVETIELLQANATVAAALVRELTDEQLARTGVYIAGEPAERVEVWIEDVLIGHPGMHLPAIRAATREQTSPEDGVRIAAAVVAAAPVDRVDRRTPSR